MAFSHPEPETASVHAPVDASKYLIEVAPEVMTHLTAEVWLAFKSVPRRGLEIGGLLTGRVRRNERETTILIDGYKTVESEHRLGPSYLLSEGDLVRFEGALAAHPENTIGLFRSHTRSGDVAP